MRFGILHLLLVALVIGFALAMRSWASIYAEQGYISMSAIGVSILTSAGFCWLGAPAGRSTLLGTAAAAMVLVSHFVECSLGTKATEYVWSSPNFRSDFRMYCFVTFILTLGCYASAAGAAFIAVWFSGRLELAQNGEGEE